MEKVDLGTVVAVQTDDGRLRRDTAEAMVAELRDAREVVEAARTQYGPRATLRVALENYASRWGRTSPLPAPTRRP